MSDAPRSKSRTKVAPAVTYGQDSIDQVARRAHGLVDQAAVAATGAIGNVAGTAQRMRAAPSQLGQSVVSGVRSYPWQALGLALAVGFIVGRLAGD